MVLSRWIADRFRISSVDSCEANVVSLPAAGQSAMAGTAKGGLRSAGRWQARHADDRPAGNVANGYRDFSLLADRA